MKILQISPEDIRWEGEEPGASRKGLQSGSGHGYKTSIDRGGCVSGSGRGRGARNILTKSDFSQTQNGIGKKSPCCIELLHTETLINKVRDFLSLCKFFYYFCLIFKQLLIVLGTLGYKDF